MKNGFGFLGIIILAAVIASAALGGGLYWSETKKQQSFFETGADAMKRAEELKQAIESRQREIYGGSTSMNSDVDISSWKTYRNEKYGFEVGYPPDWKAAELADDEKLTEFRLALLPLSSPPPQSAVLSISIMDTQQANVVFQQGRKVTTVQIANIDARRVSISNTGFENIFKIIFSPKTLPAGKSFVISGAEKYDQAISKILETFEFIE